MKLHVIRHGETVGNQSGILQGWSDSSLLPEQTAHLQAVAFDPSAYGAIFSSDAGRCIETCSALRLPDVRVDERLRERHFGLFENTPYSVLQESFSHEYSKFQDLNADDCPRGGESRIQHFNRLASWIQSAQDFETVLAVGHGGMLDFLYRLGSGLALHGGEEIFDGANGAKSEFKLQWPEVKVISFSVPLDA